MQKITINRPFQFFLAVMELVRELLIGNIEQDKCEKLFMLSRQQSQIIDVKCEKSQKICHFAFFSAIIELV